MQELQELQELHLASADRSAALTWDTSAFYSTESLQETEHLVAPEGLAGVYTGPVDLQNTAATGKTRLAAFGEISLKMMPRLTVSAAVHSERTHYDNVTELAPISRRSRARTGPTQPCCRDSGSPTRRMSANSST